MQRARLLAHEERRTASSEPQKEALPLEQVAQTAWTAGRLSVEHGAAAHAHALPAGGARRRAAPRSHLAKRSQDHSVVGGGAPVTTRSNANEMTPVVFEQQSHNP